MAKDTKAVSNSAAADDVAYILEMPNAPAVNGVQRLVNWCRGRGVLDRRAVADVMSDQLNVQTFEDKPGGHVDVLMGEIANWWGKRGVKVTKTTAAKADEYRTELELLRTAPAPVVREEEVPGVDDDELIKVSDLAKEVGMKSKEILPILQAAGIECKAAGSKVSAAAAHQALIGANPDEVPGKAPLAPHEQPEPKE